MIGNKIQPFNTYYLDQTSLSDQTSPILESKISAISQSSCHMTSAKSTKSYVNFFYPNVRQMKRTQQPPSRSRFPHRVSAVVNDLIAGIEVAFISQKDMSAVVECLKERRSEALIWNDVRSRRRIDQLLKRFEPSPSPSSHASPNRAETLLTGLLKHRIKVTDVSPDDLNSTQDACSKARTENLNKANFVKVRELDSLLDDLAGAGRTTSENDSKERFTMPDNVDELWSLYETLRDRRHALHEEWRDERAKLDAQRDEGIKAIKSSYEGKDTSDVMLQFKPSHTLHELKLAYREMMAAHQYEDAKRTGEKMKRLEEQEVKDFKRRHEIVEKHKRGKIARQLREKLQECEKYWKDRKDELEPRYIYQIDKIETRMHVIERKLHRLGYSVKNESELVDRIDREEEDQREQKTEGSVSVHSFVTFKKVDDKSVASGSYNSSHEEISA